jgi:hypothetical protein
MRISRTASRLATESRDKILLRGKVCNTLLFVIRFQINFHTIENGVIELVC